MQAMKDFRAGATAIAPAVIAMVPFALILGQQATVKGLSPLEMLAMSSIVFAGSSQFLAVSLWSFPVPVAALALAALLINLRHVLMGASLAGKISHFPTWVRVVGPYFMADETWAVVERRALGTQLTPAYYFGAALTLFSCWQVGTVLGTFLGALIEDPVKLGFDFAFPAIFISLALGFWKGMSQTGPVMAAAALVAVAVHAVVPGAWYVVAGALAGIAAAVVTTPREASKP
jgi:4-azaleucine resistance transporter AzlC